MRRTTPDEKSLKGSLKLSRLPPAPLRPLEEAPEPPEHLDERGAAAYTAIANLLVGAGRMTESDSYAVAGAASAWSDWRQAVDHLREKGLLVESGLRASPFVGIRNEADRRFRAWCQSLGFTPADRDKIGALPPPPDVDHWDGLYDGPRPENT